MVKKIIVGPLQVNCYAMTDQEKNLILIDPGDEAEKLIDFMKENQFELKAILLTHGHFDHIGAVPSLLAWKKVPVYTHEKEAQLMKDASLNLSVYFRFPEVKAEASHFLVQGQAIKISKELEFQVIEVPGHSPVSLCYYFPKQSVVFSGDTLFQQSIGRTDLYLGNSGDLVQNIKNQLFVLPEETEVYPGHGFKTSIGREKVKNPYFMQDQMWY